ncbi:TolC family protein [Prolixibacteraceae bacterium Z1-6]|uniref:TolC family protein n=1 Tax=Draconibacterium aestuarii TaxID=2998507 RepID=A0A9X3J8C7_9BACT|nr:TolC family protein [Prolixibacteraceae bacterium Z1-6]
MKIRKTLLLVFAITQLGLVVQAQSSTSLDSVEANTAAQEETTEPGQSRLVLSLDEAREFALENNREMKNAAMAVDEAGFRVKEMVATGLPQASANMDYTSFLGAEMKLQLDPNMPAQSVPFNSTSFLNVNVSQLLFSGTYLVGLQTAKLYKAMTEKSIEKSALDVKEQVSGTYFLILLSERTKDILLKNLANVSEIHRNTEVMFKVGVVEQTDVDQLSVQITMLENNLRQTERQVDMAYDMLKLQLGVDPKTQIELTETLDDFLMAFDFYNSLIKEFDLKSNVDYQLLNSQEEISLKQVSLQKMEYLPTVSANYVRTEKIKAANFDMQPNNVLGFNMSIPIFSSGMRKAKVSQAQIQLETVQNNKRQLEDALLTQERQARLNLNTALEQYNSQKKNVEVASRVFGNINRKFESGMVSSLDLTTANNNYLNAESSYIQSMLQVLDAHVALEKLFNDL